MDYLRNRFTRETKRTLTLPAILDGAVSCSVTTGWMIKIVFVPVAMQNMDMHNSGKQRPMQK